MPKQVGGFYDGTKILSLKDINGNQPEVYVVEGNRVGGKTTWFYRWRIKKFEKEGRKTMWLYRFQTDIDDCSTKIFKDVGPLFFDGASMSHKIRAKGRYADLFFEGKHMGYALPLNSADAIKNMSHVFNDVDWQLFDEFQPESQKYCPGEMIKFHSQHVSIARGGGKQVRSVPVTLISNTVSLLNPYYMALGISNKLQKRTNYLKGDGFVYEKAVIETASKALQESPFNRAFGNSGYNQYAKEAVYLEDNNNGIEKLTGESQYILTLYYGTEIFSLRYKNRNGIMYVVQGGDANFPMKISLDPHNFMENTHLKSFYKQNIGVYRQFFEMGKMRFSDLLAREAALNLVSY